MNYGAQNCFLDKGIYIEPGCVISPYAHIGFGVSINRGCTIGHHTVVQDFATINVTGEELYTQKGNSRMAPESRINFCK